MKSATAEWVKKAEGDFLTAGRELQARKSPNYDAICFHSQQCAEKYLKAVLQENDKHIPKIHNLVELMLLCEEIDSSYEMLRADLVPWSVMRCADVIPARQRRRKTLNLPTPPLGQCESLSGKSWD